MDGWSWAMVFDTLVLNYQETDMSKKRKTIKENSDPKKTCIKMRFNE